MVRFACALIALACSSTAIAHDIPSLYSSTLLGISVFPKGILTDTTVEYRVPGPRSANSMVLKNTYFGIGARFSSTPAYIDLGPTISIAPVDVFDMNIYASWTYYLGPFAPLPFDQVSGRMEPVREGRLGENFAMHKLELNINPTVKIKVGPIISFSKTNIGFVKGIKPDHVESEYWFELARSQVLAYNEVTWLNTTALLVVLTKDGAKDDDRHIWLGATSRHRNSLVSKDENTGVGPMLFFKPFKGKNCPTFVAYALFHVVDRTDERLGRPPNSAFAATWTFNRPLEAHKAVPNSL